jgi:predicted O-methyltransferase YrrM
MFIPKRLKKQIPGRRNANQALVDDGGLVVRARDVDLQLWDQLGRPPESSAQRIYLHKPRRFLSALTAAMDRIAPRRVVEIGVLDGGSTIYWAERYDVERLIAFDRAEPAPHLLHYLERHRLTDKVRVHFGVAQDDAPTMRAAMEEGFAGGAVDFIVDDASHQYRDTRATVEILLPFVRPGGAYVIEDWAWGHHENWPEEIWKDQALMSPLLSELMLVCGSGKGVIERIEIDPNFAVLWRGNVSLARDGGFRLAEHYTSRGFSAAF